MNFESVNFTVAVCEPAKFAGAETSPVTYSPARATTQPSTTTGATSMAKKRLSLSAADDKTSSVRSCSSVPCGTVRESGTRAEAGDDGALAFACCADAIDGASAANAARVTIATSFDDDLRRWLRRVLPTMMAPYER